MSFRRRLAWSVLCSVAAGVPLIACALDVRGVDGTAGSDEGGAGTDGSIARDGSSPGDDGGGTIDDAGALVDALTCDDGSTACSGACVQTSHDLQHCGACGVACPGGDASCGSGVCSATLRIRGYVDDQSQLILKGKLLQWAENKGAAPGLWQGANEPTYLDYVPWTPVWPDTGENRDCDCTSSTVQVTPLAAKAQTVVVTVVEGRSKVEIAQQPAASNDYTLVVAITDTPGGAAWYELLLGYETN